MSPIAYTIRPLVVRDAELLRVFFRKAYGEDTVFQSREFCDWFFASVSASPGDFSVCAEVALSPQGEIVAHYGTLPRGILLNGRRRSLSWGVNAYTLPAHRGAGLGKRLLSPLLDSADVFGVIGFTPEAAAFYEKLGFYLFERRRFRRYILSLSPAVREVADAIQTDAKRVERLLALPASVSPEESYRAFVPSLEIDAAHLETLCPSFESAARMTTHRSAPHLRTRFLSYLATAYRFLGASSRPGALTAYVVSRRERLSPTLYSVSRIVDLFGHPDEVSALLEEVVAVGRGRGDVYVDCSAFGSLYEAAFTRLGFRVLHEDDVEILPQVTTPIRKRPNREYVGLFSREYASEIRSLGEEDVFLTRADSDRDRVASFTALLELHGEAMRQ